MFDVLYRKYLLHCCILLLAICTLSIQLDNFALAQSVSNNIERVGTENSVIAIPTRILSWGNSDGDQAEESVLPVMLPVLHSNGDDILELCTGIIADSEAVIYDFSPSNGQVYLNDPHIWEEIVVEPCHGDSTAEVYLLGPDGQQWSPEILTPSGRYQYLFDLPYDALPGTYWLVIDGEDGNYRKAFWAEYSSERSMINILDSETNQRSSFYKEGYTLDARGRTLQIQYFGFPANTDLAVGLYQSNGEDNESSNSSSTENSSRLNLIETWTIETNQVGTYSEDISVAIDAPAGSYYLVACQAENCHSSLNHLAMSYNSVLPAAWGWDWFVLSGLSVSQAPTPAEENINPAQTAPRLPDIAQAPTSTATATRTPKPTATSTSRPTKTPTATSTPRLTNTPPPTNTPTATNTPTSTDTPTSRPTNTLTLTNTPLPTDTLVPTSTDTPTSTATPLPTDTLVPTSTDTPTSTAMPLPTDTLVPTDTTVPTDTPTTRPTNTSTATPLPTDTRQPPAQSIVRPGGMALPAPVALTMAFYNAIDAGAKSGDFSQAYSYLSSSRQTRQSYTEFADSFETTIGVEIKSLELLESDSDSASVNAVIIATDTIQNGTQKASYNIVYQLIKEESIWKMSEARVRRLSTEITVTTPTANIDAADREAEPAEVEPTVADTATTNTATPLPTATPSPIATQTATTAPSPTSKPTATPLPTETPEPTAVSSATSGGLSIGSLARLDPVAASDGLNIRSEPGLEGNIKGGVPPNGLVTILSGPTDVNGTAWRSIEYTNLSGWIIADDLLPFADRAAEYFNLHWVPGCEPERAEVELLEPGQINCSDTADALNIEELDAALRSVGLLEDGETIQPRSLGERQNLGIVIRDQSSPRVGWIRIGGGNPGGIWRTNYTGTVPQVGPRCWLRSDRTWRCE